MTITHKTEHLAIALPTSMPAALVPSALSAISALDDAQDDLVRLCALLDDAFGELLRSFSAVQLAAQSEAGASEINRIAGHAIVALQCEDMASQLISHTRKRLVAARESLKILAQMPQIAVTDSIWATGIATLGDLPLTAPVQQDAIAAGTAELF